MRKIRFKPLIIFSFVLMLLSFGVMGNWAYKVFIKPKNVYTGELIVLKPVAAPESMETATETKEPSHKKVKSKKVDNPDENNKEALKIPQVSNPGSVEQLSSNVPDKATRDEIKKLKAEIENLLYKSGDAGLKQANQRIDELEQKIIKLNTKNSDVERENNKLLSALRNFSDKRFISEQSTKAWPAVYENNSREMKQAGKPTHISDQPVIRNSNKIAASGSKMNEFESAGNSPASGNGILSIDDMNLRAFMVTDNKDLETFQANQTDKFVGSLSLKNISFPENNGEIFIIVLQPDGRVLQKSVWETGTFQSPEGKKVYSCRVRFDISKGESKNLYFSLNTANCMKGKYIMQVYNKKGLIGKFTRSLS